MMDNTTTPEQEEMWDKLNDKQKQFVIYRLQKMDRVDAYMKAYSISERGTAINNVSRLMRTNVYINAILEEHFLDCIGVAKEILREEAPKSARTVMDVRDYGNREYIPRLQAAIFNLKAVGADVPARVQVEQTGDTAPGLVVIGMDVSKYPKQDSGDSD